MGAPEVGPSEGEGSSVWVESPEGAGSGGSGGGWTFLPSQVLKCDTK